MSDIRELNMTGRVMNDVPEMLPLRYERKIALRNGGSYAIFSRLKSLGFREVYPVREVSSVYFDEPDLSCLTSSFNGDMNRLKLRLRYYNSDVKHAKLELKRKNGYLGNKKTITFPGEFFDLDEALLVCQQWINSNLSRAYIPTAKVSYQRVYLEKDYLRITLDRHVSGERLFGSTGVKSRLGSYDVVEFKYAAEFDCKFRLWFEKLSFIPIRVTKSSKYTNVFKSS